MPTKKVRSLITESRFPAMNSKPSSWRLQNEPPLEVETSLKQDLFLRPQPKTHQRGTNYALYTFPNYNVGGRELFSFHTN
jgi:hypothetical protein